MRGSRLLLRATRAAEEQPGQHSPLGDIAEARPAPAESAEIVPNQQSCAVLGGALRLLCCTSTGSLVDGVHTAPLVLASARVLANGGADVSVGGARVLHCAGRGAAAAASVGRSSSHSEAVT
jgi:hypothetical protein